jgi:hypothetical protein
VNEELKKIKTNFIDEKLQVWEDLSSFQEQEPEERLDNNYFSIAYEKALEALDTLPSSKYRVKSIQEIIEYYQSGLDPEEEETAVPLLEGKNVMPNVILPTFDKFVLTVDDETKLINADDILITKDGSPAVASAITEGLVKSFREDFGYERVAIATHVYKVKLKDGYKPHSAFIATFINSKLGQALIRRYFSGSVSSTVRGDELIRVLVVIPNDNEISETIKKEIQKLQDEAIHYSRYVEISNQLVTRMFGRELKLPKLPINWMPTQKDAHGYFKNE